MHTSNSPVPAADLASASLAGTLPEGRRRPQPSGTDAAVAALAETFASLLDDDPDEALARAVATIAEAFGAARVTLSLIGPLDGHFSVIADWPSRAVGGTVNLPWSFTRLRGGARVVVLDPDDLPADAWPEARAMADAGVRAAVRLPLFHEARASHCLGLDFADGGEGTLDAARLERLDAAAGLLQSLLHAHEVTRLLKTVSHYDRLTGLANRALLNDRLEQAMARVRRNGQALAVVFLNIDRFNVINDALGYRDGDRLLKRVAERLVDAVRQTDTVARVGGDDFVVLLDQLNRIEDVRRTTTRIAESFEKPIEIGGQEVFASLSQGVASYAGERDAEVDTVIQEANAAMLRAKTEGGGRLRHHRANGNGHSRRRLGMEKGLRRALNRGEFEVFYQPQLDLACDALAGAEALIRWRSPELGLTGPGSFLSVAEETGLIVPLSEWILSEACAAACNCRRSSGSDIHMAVNVSPRWFQHPAFPSFVDRVLTQTGLPPESLEIEITEDVVLTDKEAARPLLRNIADSGVRIALDDFGTGFSSLSYLQDLPVHTLKIDRSFIGNVTRRDSDAAIVCSVIALCEKLGIRVVAEGVEHQEQLDFLRANGCHHVQGYLIGRPTPIADLNRLLPDGAATLAGAR